MRTILFTRTKFVCGLIALALFCSAPSQSFGQTNDPDLERAIKLYDQNNFVDAVPLFEKLVQKYPDNPQILSRYGFALYAVSSLAKDADSRQRGREKAREILERSVSLGDNSNLTR